jgi:hypothetical protein
MKMGLRRMYPPMIMTSRSQSEISHAPEKALRTLRSIRLEVFFQCLVFSHFNHGSEEHSYLPVFEENRRRNRDTRASLTRKAFGSFVLRVIGNLESIERTTSPTDTAKSSMPENPIKDVKFTRFRDETQLKDIIALIANDLSEPYSIYVYRYFIQQWYVNALKRSNK